MTRNDYVIRSAAVDITNKCNFRCLHCFNYSGEHKREKEMTNDEIVNVFNDIIEFQPDSICICGGEPLLRLELVYELCELVKHKNDSIMLNMVSNGFLFNEEVAFNLKTKGLNLVQFSLDGASSQTHNWIRNSKYAYEHVINAIKCAKKVGLEVGIACCPTTVNRNEIDEVVNLCSQLGVKIFRMQPLMLMGRGAKLKEFELSDEEYHKLSRLLKKCSNKKMKIEWGDPLQHIQNIAVTNLHNSYVDLGISAYGDIMVSPYIPIKIGNIKERRLQEYFEVGLQDIYLDTFIKKVASLMGEWKNMNLHDDLLDFPILGLNENINYDLLDKDNNDTILIEKIMKYESRQL